MKVTGRHLKAKCAAARVAHRSSRPHLPPTTSRRAPPTAETACESSIAFDELDERAQKIVCSSVVRHVERANEGGLSRLVLFAVGGTHGNRRREQCVNVDRRAAEPVQRAQWRPDRIGLHERRRIR